MKLIHSRFDERCPHCDMNIREQLRRQWEYRDSYQINCDGCKRLVQVDVHSIPEFETSPATCQKCNKNEIHSGWYCPDCQAELDALSERNKQKAQCDE